MKTYIPLSVRLVQLVTLALAVFGVLALLAHLALASDVRGVLYDRGVLVPSEVQDYDLQLRGGEVTVILVRGDGEGDIDCVLASPQGVPVAFDVRPVDGCLLAVLPSDGYTAPLWLRLVNHGAQATEFAVEVR
jgi:hypothetical protein